MVICLERVEIICMRLSDATVTPSALASVKSGMVYLSGVAYPVFLSSFFCLFCVKLFAYVFCF